MKLGLLERGYPLYSASIYDAIILLAFANYASAQAVVRSAPRTRNFNDFISGVVNAKLMADNHIEALCAYPKITDLACHLAIVKSTCVSTGTNFTCLR